MDTQFLIAGTLTGGVVLSVLGWFTAAILPPRFNQFRDPSAVVEVVRANALANGIYTAPQGLFAAVSLEPDLSRSRRLQNAGARMAGQFLLEFGVALCLCALLLATNTRSPLRAAGLLGFIGLIAGSEVRFPEWNWEGFPITHLLAGTGYLTANWLITGLVLGTLCRRLESKAAGGSVQTNESRAVQ